MKKILVLGVVFVLLFALLLTACDTNENDSPSDDSAECQHSFGDMIIVKQATCVEDGQLVRTCSSCGFEETTVIVAVGSHAEVIDAAEVATCTAPGKTEGKHCSVCGTVLVAQTTIDALGHTFGEWITIREPTMTYTGLAKRSCACGETETKELDELESISGKCGDNLTWTFYKTGELVIEGTGDMYDYEMGDLGCFSYDTPWYDLSFDIKKITLTEGVTSIGDFAFSGLAYSQFNVVIPNSVTAIGEGAFASSYVIGSLEIPNSVTTIGDRAFWWCSGFTGDLVIPNSVTSIGQWAFFCCSGFTKATIYGTDVGFDDGVFSGTRSDFTIYGYAGSTAQTYARENGFQFVAIN